ncbi:putative zinc ribbon domain protein [Bacteroides sp. CAG:1060]|nr:putative zinc ribbon domain protein [Bacteroides sp. CAG:1060]
MASIKKKVNVPTPIDERETFVSLRKNFAENEQLVQEKLKTLYELQNTDIEIDKLLQLRGELPEEVSALESEVESLKTKKARMEEMIDGYNQGIENDKKHIDELDKEIEEYRKKLENISNSREYDSVNKELENQGLLRAISEKNIREAREAIDSRRQDIERIDDRISIREADLEAKRSELSTITEATAPQEKELVARREAFISKLDERTISAYERIRKSTHNHLAVVSLFPKNEDGTYGDACGGCFHTITPQRLIDIASGKKLVICEHCGRIIVNPEI